MADGTHIEWTTPPGVVKGATWNFIGGCERHSPGCENCWAERDTARFAQNPSTPRFKGLAVFRDDGEARWSREVRLFAYKLAEPLHWRAPRGVFVCSKADLFHKDVPNDFIAAVFGIMAACPQHTFFVLTKRAERLPEWFKWLLRRAEDGLSVFPHDPTEWRIRQMMVANLSKLGITTRNSGLIWPLPNVWLGATVEDRARKTRLEYLRQVPAAVRWVSLEPLLEDLGAVDLDGIHWAVIGGESSARARACDLGWIRSLRDQCRQQHVATFIKQLGARPVCGDRRMLRGLHEERLHVVLDDSGQEQHPLILRDRKGGSMEEWPEDLRVREFPVVCP